MRHKKSVATASQLRMSFTLVEVLIVIGIMGILMFIGLPAFEKLVKGTGVELATRTVASKLGIARSYAITNRQYVAVLMPDKDSSPVLPVGVSGLGNFPYMGMKLCVVSSTSTTSGGITTYTFKRWIPSENWSFLPTGTAIIHIDNTAGFVDGSSSDHEEVDSVNLHEIKPSATTYDTVNDIKAIVFKPTGKPVGSGARYVTVGESTYNGTALVHPGASNRMDVKVDQYTGKVTIITPGME